MSSSALGSLRRRLTYANVVATLALFVAVSGGGFAIASHLTVRSSDIVKNAVRSKHIKNGQVQTADLAGSAVTSGKLAQDLRPRWARVGVGTELQAGRGVVNVRAATSGEGRIVEFDSDISACSAAVTPRGATEDIKIPFTNAGEREVWVFLRTPDGSLVGGHFDLQLDC